MEHLADGAPAGKAWGREDLICRLLQLCLLPGLLRLKGQPRYTPTSEQLLHL